MKNTIIIALISTISLAAQFANAREIVISTRIGTGVTYSDRSYDDLTDSEGVSLPPLPDDVGTHGNEPQSQPPVAMDSNVGMGVPQDDERGEIVISPTLTLFTKTSSDSAILSYTPSINYDFIESEASDINHKAHAGYQKELTDSWDLKIYDLFKYTDEYENNRPNDHLSENDFVDELISSIPAMNDTLRDDFGRRRYFRNELTASTGFNYAEGNRVSLGYGWDHLEYDEDETDSGRYQDYDKYKVSLAVSHELTSLWTVKGYTQYLRGSYDTEDASDDDLNEFHLGGILETDIIQSHPMSLSYDFSQTNYDDDTVDTSRIHKLTLGYQLISSPAFEVHLGAGPTYTKISDSEDSWDFNGYLNVLYNTGPGSFRFTSDVGTIFDNFSGTEDRGLTDYWLSRIEYSSPVNESWRILLYGGYREETRDEVNSDSDIDVNQLFAGGRLTYSINDSYDVNLSLDHTVQESDRSTDSYDESRGQLSLTYKTDLFSW